MRNQNVQTEKMAKAFILIVSKNVQVEIQAFCSKQLIHENILTKLDRYACRCAPNVSLGIWLSYDINCYSF